MKQNRKKFFYNIFVLIFGFIFGRNFVVKYFNPERDPSKITIKTNPNAITKNK